MSKSIIYQHINLPIFISIDLPVHQLLNIVKAHVILSDPNLTNNYWVCLVAGKYI